MSYDSGNQSGQNRSQPSGERVAVLEQQYKHISGKLEEILVQTTRTNGRVDRLEAWRNQIQGGWWVVLAVAAASTTIGAFVGWALHAAKMIP